jgi:hypothetical protein
MFKSVHEYNPHVWLWLGDAAYTDDLKAGVSKLPHSQPFDRLT